MKKSNQQNTITRREFLRNMSLAGLGLAIAPPLLNFHMERAYALENVGKIVVTTGDELTTGYSINQDVAKTFLHAGIKALTDKTSVPEAWNAILPSLTKSDVIGIKVNTINRHLSSHPEVVYAIADSLTQFAGVPANNIIIWDRTTNELRNNGRYQINTGETGVRCFGTDTAGWKTDRTKGYKVGGSTQYLSKILTQGCTYLINVPVLKDHGTAGITLSMKNHYGTVNNPGALHGNHCDPYIADLYNTPPIKEKNKLIVLDAALGIYAGGPSGAPQFLHNSIIVSQDPVALDQYGLQIIEEERKNRNVAQIGNRAKHIQTAARLGLGTNDQNEIKVIFADALSVDAKGKQLTTLGGLKKSK